MKTVGLLGGMSWESTLEYYRLINEGVRERLGKLHSAKIVMVSVDFEPLERMQHAGDWTSIARLLADEARRISAAATGKGALCGRCLVHIVLLQSRAAHGAGSDTPQ